MKYLLILLLFCSCQSTFMVNGTPIKQKVKPVSHDEKPIYIAAFLLGAGLTSIYIKP